MTISSRPFTETQEGDFVKHNRTLDRPTTIAHWQLRDLVCCPDEADTLYTVHDSCTIKYNISTSQSTVVQGLHFRPTSMACNGDYIAAGGQQQELDVKNLNTGATIYKDTVGDSVNNALHIGTDCSGQLRLLVCNNDKSVRVFSLPRMNLAYHIDNLPAPVNYAALSPRGDHLGFVGDCNHCFLYKTTPSGYHRIGTMTEAEDSGMCCAWNAMGSCIASAAQDGTVCVWDVRSFKLVAKYGSRSAFRAVKFSSAASPVDLLAFSEHDTAVHIVDSRMYGSRQLMRIAHQEQEADVSGIAFSRDGSRFYIGMCDGINEYHVDTAARCNFQQGSLI